MPSSDHYYQAQQLFWQAYGHSRNMITDNVLGLYSIVKDGEVVGAIELSTGDFYPLRPREEKFFGVTVVRKIKGVGGVGWTAGRSTDESKLFDTEAKAKAYIKKLQEGGSV